MTSADLTTSTTFTEVDALVDANGLTYYIDPETNQRVYIDPGTGDLLVGETSADGRTFYINPETGVETYPEAIESTVLLYQDPDTGREYVLGENDSTLYIEPLSSDPINTTYYDLETGEIYQVNRTPGSDDFSQRVSPAATEESLPPLYQDPETGQFWYYAEDGTITFVDSEAEVATFINPVTQEEIRVDPKRDVTFEALSDAEDEEESIVETEPVSVHNSPVPPRRAQPEERMAETLSVDGLDLQPYRLVLCTSRMKIVDIHNFLSKGFGPILEREAPEGSTPLPAVTCIRIIHRRSSYAPVNSDREDTAAYVEGPNNVCVVHPRVHDLLQNEPSFWGETARTARSELVFDNFLIRKQGESIDSLVPANCAPALFIDTKKSIPFAESKAQIETKMHRMVLSGFVGPNQYQLHYPTQLNDPTRPRGYCIITFSDVVYQTNRVVIRAALDQTKWAGPIDPTTGRPELFICRVSWAKKETMEVLERAQRHRSRDSTSHRSSRLPTNSQAASRQQETRLIRKRQTSAVTSTLNQSAPKPLSREELNRPAPWATRVPASPKPLPEGRQLVTPKSEPKSQPRRRIVTPPTTQPESQPKSQPRRRIVTPESQPRRREVSQTVASSTGLFSQPIRLQYSEQDSTVTVTRGDVTVVTPIGAVANTMSSTRQSRAFTRVIAPGGIPQRQLNNQFELIATDVSREASRESSPERSMTPIRRLNPPVRRTQPAPELTQSAREVSAGKLAAPAQRRTLRR